MTAKSLRIIVVHSGSFEYIIHWPHPRTLSVGPLDLDQRGSYPISGSRHSYHKSRYEDNLFLISRCRVHQRSRDARDRECKHVRMPEALMARRTTTKAGQHASRAAVVNPDAPSSSRVGSASASRSSARMMSGVDPASRRGLSNR